MLLSASLLSLSAALATSPHWDRPLERQVHIGAHTGYPWNGLQLAYSPTESWVLTAEVESALFIRSEARVGARKHWALPGKWSTSLNPVSI